MRIRNTTSSASAAVKNWNNLTILNLSSVSSGEETYVFNANSGSTGNTGWGGLATITNYSGCTILRATAQLNTYYSWTTNAARGVHCQEVGVLVLSPIARTVSSRATLCGASSAPDITILGGDRASEPTSRGMWPPTLIAAMVELQVRCAIFVARSRFAVRAGMMKRSVLALFLLSTLLFGWVAGPHLCHKSVAGERLSGHASCHEMSSEDGASTVERVPSLEAHDCCDIVCQHACHMVAVLSVNQIVSTAAPLSQKPSEKPGQSVPVVAFRIDHVPLA